MATFETQALITEEGRRREREHRAIGKAFRIVSFSLHNEGHDPNDPTMAVAPNPEITECPTPVFGPKAITNASYASSTCNLWECFLAKGEAVVNFSGICLVAQIVFSPIPSDPELNTTFLYAVGAFPQRPKGDTEALSIIVGLQG